MRAVLGLALPRPALASHEQAGAQRAQHGQQPQLQTHSQTDRGRQNEAQDQQQQQQAIDPAKLFSVPDSVNDFAAASTDVQALLVKVSSLSLKQHPASTMQCTHKLL